MFLADCNSYAYHCGRGLSKLPLITVPWCALRGLQIRCEPIHHNFAFMEGQPRKHEWGVLSLSQQQVGGNEWKG